MGREVKRVALDFDWPLAKIWDGYCNPHWKECDECGGRCSTEGEALLHALALRLETAAYDAKRGALHPYTQGLGIRRPLTHDIVELVEGLTGKPLESHCHSSQRYEIQQAFLKAAGVPERWGVCRRCDGEGVHPEAKEASDAWQDYEPPEGEGWQMWETTSEGSPITPVFATAEGLVECLVNGQDESSRRRGTKYSREAAEAFVKSGWVPSGVTSADGKFYRDIDSTVLQQEGENK